MFNLLWGIPVTAGCIAGFWYAWRLAKAERYDAALVFILLCGLILRVYTAADANLHDWDERYHALVAKNLTQHWLKPTLYDHPLLPYKYTDWTANHIWLHKQPLALWLMALCIKLFGAHAFVIRIPAILLTAFAIWLVYQIAKSLYDARVAIISAFLCAIHGLVIELASGRAGTDSIDAVFFSFVTLSIWMIVKAVSNKSYALHLVAGVFLGLALLTKWLPALIALPVWLILSMPRFKGERIRMLGCLACLLFAATAIALPWQLYTISHFPLEAKWEHSYNQRHFCSALEGHDGGFFYHFDHLRMKYGELVYLSILWVTWNGIKHGRVADRALLLWLWGTFLPFSFAATKMEAYTIIAAPSIFIITALAFVHLGTRLADVGKYRWMLTLIWISLLALPARYTLERVKPFAIMNRNPEWNKEITAVRKSEANNYRTVFVGCSHPIELMFATDCMAYREKIDSVTRVRLIYNGYTVQNSTGALSIDTNDP